LKAAATARRQGLDVTVGPLMCADRVVLGCGELLSKSLRLPPAEAARWPHAARADSPRAPVPAARSLALGSASAARAVRLRRGCLGRQECEPSKNNFLRRGRQTSTVHIAAMLVEHPHDLGHGAELQEHLEHKLQTLLNRQVGVRDQLGSRIRPIGG
jgi:hypothetical protein